MTTFDIFGLHMTTKQAGTALLSLGLVICILAFRKAVKAFIGIPLFLRK